MATPQNVQIQLWDGSVWTDQPTLSDEPVKILRGDDGESGTRPAQFTARLQNDDSRYRTSDPMSPLYGLAGRNTRCRVRVGGVTRTQAEAGSWKNGKTPEHQAGLNLGLSWADLQAEGLLRRIGQWDTPLRSPLYRAVSRLTTLTGYWPMEDGTKATQLTNALGGGQPAVLREAEVAGIDGPGGSDPVVKIEATTRITGTFKTASTTAGWQISFAAYLPAVPGSATYWPYMQWWTKNGNRWTMEVNNTAYQWTIIDTSGALVKQFAVGHGAGAAPNQWLIHRIKVSQVGGNVQIEPAWYIEGTGTLYGWTDSYVGSVNVPDRWRISGNVHNTGGGIGHLFGVTTVADDLQSWDITRGFDGYPGEYAMDRFTRLMREENLSNYFTGANIDTAPMGVQRSGTLMSHLEEIRTTDNCFIFDERLDIALRMVGRRVCMNQPVALALTYPGDIAPVLEEVTDDLGTANYVTAANARGGEYTAILESGPMSVLAPPTGVGVAKKKYDVNVADETLQLQQTAEWYLGLGTIDRVRYPKVTVDLLKNPALTAATEAVDISDRITITGLERALVDLIVVGVTETVGHITRTFEFTCLPADILHNIAVYDDPGSRYDSASTTLVGAQNTTSVSWALTTVERLDVWSVADGPVACEVDGETVTMTAVTAPAGTGPYTQTATVTRSVNGVVKIHAAGRPFRLANPVYVGL